MSDPQTLFDLSEGVATITLNRPERMNAWTAQMGAELFEHLLRCDEDDSVRAIVVTGAGKAFCAGADLERGGETFAGSGDRNARRTIQPWEVLGLVNEAVPATEVLRRARQIACDIAENCAPVSVALTKRMLWEHLGGPPPVEVAKREAKALWALGRMADAHEGVQSFLEKRKPRWSLSPTRDLPELPPFDQ